MANVFPHLNDTNFPNAGNVDVYQYRNDFDYTRYDYSQMEILICNVPWDVGEARIGNRTISGIGNVVYFETKEKRDEWFDAIPDNKCFRWSTKLKELHRSNTIDVPLPFDIAAKFNYVVVRYNLFANDGSPVLYEDMDGLREWFWFIREVEFLAPNTTRLHLLNDAWQTFIYDLDITGMILERGHAPMFKTKTDSYLQNPIGKSGDLLTVDYMPENVLSYSVYQDEYIFNDAQSMKAVIVTTANPTSSAWGSKSDDTWRTPAGTHYVIQGNPAYCAFAIDATSLSNFINNMSSSVPQFAQTLKGIFFIRADMLTLGTAFTFCDIPCNIVGGSYKSVDVLTINKSKFGYPSRYADIAKLYTYPYARIEVSDENGNVTDIRIESTNGKITLKACINLVYPFIKINGHITSSGKAASDTITFKNVDSRTMPIGGNWYEYLMEWDIPVFGIVQDPRKFNDYNTHFDRKQQQIAYTNAYDSSVASANTAQTNANASADLVTSNATLTTTANSAITVISNGSADDSLDNTRDYNFGVMDTDNAVIGATATSQIDAQEQQAAVTAASGAITGAVGAIASAATGNIAGAVSGAINGLVGAASTLASTNISVHLTAAQAAISQSSNEDHSELSTEKSENDAATQKVTATSITNAQNTLTTGTASNTSATEKANALRANTTDTANAGRSRNTAINAVSNQIAQASLNAPEEFGSFGYGDNASTRPVGMFANIVTMSNNGIEQVGDEFLRYGYEYGKQWDFNGNWNIGNRFTYWELRDFWVEGLSIADMYVDKLRFFLFGGVTVWRSPEYIGHTSIYDNGI